MGVVTLACAWLAVAPGCAQSDVPDPKRFASAIAAFEDADRREAPPEGAVVVTGSSSIRRWHDAMADDLAPLTVVRRGFGGSTMRDLAYYLDRIALGYAPRAIVIYEGDNDIAQGVTPRAILATFREVVARSRAALPNVRIYVISIKPSLARASMWDDMQETNALLAEECAGSDSLTFIDVAGSMLRDDGAPRDDIFVEDGLHLNPAGYALWRSAIRPVLMEGEARYE